jgi:uncharacterized membrane protein
MKVSLWFVPLVMAVAAVLLSRLVGRLDALIPNEALNNSQLVLAGNANNWWRSPCGPCRRRSTILCLDYLADGLAKYVRLGETSPNFYDNTGKLGLVFEPVRLPELLDAAFNMLRHASCDNASVLLHLLDAIDTIGQEAKPAPARQELLAHVHLVQAESQASALIEPDKDRVRLRCEMVQENLISVEV